MIANERHVAQNVHVMSS